jgi:hypothetical protein
MNKQLIYTLYALSWLLLATGATAFDIDGFRSGMTREQLSAEAKNGGLEANQGPYGSWYIGKAAENRIDGTFSFCGKALVSYHRSVDFDVDYTPSLRTFIEKHGQPRRVRTTQNPWTGPGGGSIARVDMAWYAGNDRITLSFSPEGRDGKGQLRHNRGASISYDAKNPCLKDF